MPKNQNDWTSRAKEPSRLLTQTGGLSDGTIRELQTRHPEPAPEPAMHPDDKAFFTVALLAPPLAIGGTLASLELIKLLPKVEHPLRPIAPSILISVPQELTGDGVDFKNPDIIAKKIHTTLNGDPKQILFSFALKRGDIHRTVNFTTEDCNGGLGETLNGVRQYFGMPDDRLPPPSSIQWSDIENRRREMPAGPAADLGKK